MRLSQAHHRVTAATIVNYATPQELRTIFGNMVKSHTPKKLLMDS